MGVMDLRSGPLNAPAVQPQADPFREASLVNPSADADRDRFQQEIALSARTIAHTPPREYSVREDQRGIYVKAFTFQAEKNAPIQISYEHRSIEGEPAQRGRFDTLPRSAGPVAEPLVGQLSIDRSHPRCDSYNVGIFPEFDGSFTVHAGAKNYVIDSSPRLKLHA